MFQKIESLLMKKSSGYIICLFLTAAICAPILSISSPGVYLQNKSLVSGNLDEAGEQFVVPVYEKENEDLIPGNQDFIMQTDFELKKSISSTSYEYFNPDGFTIVEYTREEFEMINRSLLSESEDLLFGTIDDEFESDSIPVPPDMTFEEDNTIVYIIANTLSFRELPTVKSEILKTYYFGNSILRTGIGEDWHRVEDSQGNTGYMMSTYFSLTKPTPPPTPTPIPTRAPARANTLGESIALEAQKYIGVRYRFAQHNPNTGFDCSGLTWYVFNRYGISTPRSSFSYTNAGIVIPYSEIAPGDVITWNNGRGNSLDHVGIYIGNGQMVHAALNSGVTIHGVQQYRNWGYRLMSVHRFIKE